MSQNNCLATSIIKHAVSSLHFLQTILNAFGIYEFLPNYLEIKSWLAHTICGTSPTYERLCRGLIQSHFYGDKKLKKLDHFFFVRMV